MTIDFKTDEDGPPNKNKLLCLPGTSVPLKRLFGSAGYIVNKTRSSFEPRCKSTLTPCSNQILFNMLVCLSSWLSDDI